MDGVINVYKPAGMTSFACVSKVRRALGEKKAGHAGTLDPEASGVLPVCIGKGTKCVDEFLNMPKRYTGEVTFGFKTDTCDIWGMKTDSVEVDDNKLKSLDINKVIEAAEHFRGEIEQIPPDYAAIKIGGVPAYKLARQGKEFEMRSRKVTVYDITVKDFVVKEGEYPKAVIDVKCSRGTYIGSIFRDLGEYLGVFGCMSALERTEYGFLSAQKGVRVEDIEKNTVVCYTPDYILKDYKKIILDKKEEKKYRNGVSFEINNILERVGVDVDDGELLRVYTTDKRFLATSKAQISENHTMKLITDK
ncbi:MAG: tRNA pseudouridine(55) synthase TruB, partial [Clostridia bacterium]|nr:tRNA pseudouridine(55) synthase TruB [Clostridia bacterium]